MPLRADAGGTTPHRVALSSADLGVTRAQHENAVRPRRCRSRRPSGADTGPLLFGLDSAADLLAVSRRTIERMVASGAIASVVVRRRRLLTRDALDLLITRSLGSNRWR